MNHAFQFRSRFAFGGEFLTQQVPILPVKAFQTAGRRNTDAVKSGYSFDFLPVFAFNGKNLTVAQPLLLEDLR